VDSQHAVGPPQSVSSQSVIGQPVNASHRRAAPFHDAVRIRRRFRFTSEAQNLLFARELSAKDHFKRDDSIEADLPRSINDAHAAASYFLDQLIIAEPGDLDRWFFEGRPNRRAIELVLVRFGRIGSRQGQHVRQRALSAKTSWPVIRDWRSALRTLSFSSHTSS
jgi:hypothetical protein